MRSSLAVSVALLALCTAALADWVNVGPPGGPVYSAAVTAGSPPGIYIGSNNSNYPLLRSTDYGATWASYGANLANRPEQLAAHPTDPNRLYGVASSQFYRTTDGGTTWLTSSLGSNTYGNDVVVNPLNPQVIYVPGYRYNGSAWRINLARSTDGGATWTPVQVDTIACTSVYSAAIDPVDTTVLYVGAYYNSMSIVFKSTDRGTTWSRSNLGDAYYVYALNVDPANRNTVLAGTYSYGIWRSTDAGATWTRQATSSYNYRFARDPGNPAYVYSAAYSGVYRSTDGGANWTYLSSGLAGAALRVVVTIPGQNGTVLAGSSGGMFKSTNYGANWTATNNGIAIGNIPALAHVPGSTGGTRVEFLDYDNFRTTDNGNTWSAAPTPLSCGNVCGIAFARLSPQRVWMLEGSG
jgi:photosystem II stability/assembly factor-like uncharacterized protein